MENTAIQRMLWAMHDRDYRIFQCKLMPTVDPETVIGVRTPALRALAKKLIKEGSAEAFWRDLPHRYYEENNLHAFLIELIADYAVCIRELQRFLPYVDNWATCDMMRPRCFGKNKTALVPEIVRWLDSPHPYTVRFGIEMLMVHFLDDDFAPCYLRQVANIRSEHYYVNMMIAWYFATALAKQYKAALLYLTGACLSPWVHQKTIQKAMESRRVTDEHKRELQSLLYFREKKGTQQFYS